MGISDRVQVRGFQSPEARAFVGLVVAAEYLLQESGAVCARHGITGDQYNVLRILRGAHPHGHPRHEISQRLMRRSPDVTRLLDRLAREGLVVRDRGAEDRRLSVARITEDGLELLQRLDPEIDALMDRLMAPLGAERLRHLVDACEALIE